MIYSSETENFKNITKISILDSRLVFYPLSYVLQKRDVIFDDELALIIKPLPEDIKFPGSAKMTDSGVTREYKVEISINNQLVVTEEKLQKFHHGKIIMVLHHPEGKIIIGCNEMPLDFIFVDDNTTNPASDNGFTIICRGTSYSLKVSL